MHKARGTHTNEWRFPNKKTNTAAFLRAQERDNAVCRQRECERELDELRGRFDASQRAWTSNRVELERRDVADRAAQTGTLAAQTAAAAHRDFKVHLARLLSDAHRAVQPYDEQIHTAINEVMTAGREREAVSGDGAVLGVVCTRKRWGAH